jgi:hypothetical protein
MLVSLDVQDRAQTSTDAPSRHRLVVGDFSWFVEVCSRFGYGATVAE